MSSYRELHVLRDLGDPLLARFEAWLHNRLETRSEPPRGSTTTTGGMME